MATWGILRYDSYGGETFIGNSTNGEQAMISPSGYQNRLHYKGTVNSSSSVSFNSDTQAIIDDELDLSNRYGVGCWPTCLYPEEPGLIDATGNGAWTNMNYGMKRFFTSTKRGNVKFCHVITGGNMTTRPQTSYTYGWNSNLPSGQQITDFIVAKMGHSAYMTIGGRPLLFVCELDAGITNWGSAANLKAALDALRTAATTAGLSNPYIVGMQADAGSYVTSLGLQAVSCYGAAPTGAVAQQTYANLKTVAEGIWATQLATGAQVIPMCAVGRDSRCRAIASNPYSTPVPGPNEAWAVPATDSELAAHHQAAVDFIAAHAANCVPNMFVTYAYNEVSEGAYLAPCAANNLGRSWRAIGAQLGILNEPAQTKHSSAGAPVFGT